MLLFDLFEVKNPYDWLWGKLSGITILRKEGMLLYMDIKQQPGQDAISFLVTVDQVLKIGLNQGMMRMKKA